MREGGLDAPVRHPIDWQNPDFYDPAEIDRELRRVFDVCHGCRRCFNLCDAFPKLFELIDQSESGELDSVDSAGFGAVVAACTLCDICFMASCPYVPPHDFAIDFPHLMLRARAADLRRTKTGWAKSVDPLGGLLRDRLREHPGRSTASDPSKGGATMRSSRRRTSGLTLTWLG